jgi:uncharacterized cupredoxin-like copper-binding protein
MRLNPMHPLLLALTLLAATTLAHADPTAVKVRLLDEPDGQMSLTLDKPAVEAGAVEFVIANESSAMKHEVMIVPWPEGTEALPYNDKAQQADEDHLASMVGVEDINPQQTVTARFVLSKGRYLLFCNEPGHYRANMKTVLTVN